MNTRLLTNEDKGIMLDYIRRNSIETTFLFANVMELGVENRKEMRRCADYYGFFEEEELKGILPFYNLGSCIPHYESPAAIPEFAGIMKERDFEFLLGMERVVGPLYQEIKDFKNVLDYSESSYMFNRSFRPFRVDGLEFIHPEPGADDGVIDFLVKVRTDGFQEKADRESVLKTLDSAEAKTNALIAVWNGKPVAYASLQTYTDTVYQIGSVYTARDERGKGYCKAVVSELCSRIVANGKIPTLSVKKKNTPAVMAYTALGFKHFDDYLLIRFGRITE